MNLGLDCLWVCAGAAFQQIFTSPRVCHTCSYVMTMNSTTR